MKFVFLVLYLLCYSCSKFNVSIILNSDDETIISKRGSYLKVGSLFEDIFDIEYVKSSRETDLFINTGVRHLNTEISTIYSRRVLHAFCDSNIVYSSLIYNVVNKCIQ